MVNKLTTVSKERLGQRIGRLDDQDAVRPSRAITVFLGLASITASTRRRGGAG